MREKGMKTHTARKRESERVRSGRGRRSHQEMLSHPFTGIPWRTAVGRSLSRFRPPVLLRCLLLPHDPLLQISIKEIFECTCTCTCACVCVSWSPACLRLGRSRSRFGPCSLHAHDRRVQPIRSKVSVSSASRAISLLSPGLPDGSHRELCPTLPNIVVPHQGRQDAKKVPHRPPRAMGTVASRRTRGTHTNSMYSVCTVDHPQSPDRPQMPPNGTFPREIRGDLKHRAAHEGRCVDLP